MHPSVLAVTLNCSQHMCAGLQEDARQLRCGGVSVVLAAKLTQRGSFFFSLSLSPMKCWSESSSRFAAAAHFEQQEIIEIYLQCLLKR